MKINQWLLWIFCSQVWFSVVLCAADISLTLYSERISDSIYLVENSIHVYSSSINLVLVYFWRTINFERSISCGEINFACFLTFFGNVTDHGDSSTRSASVYCWIGKNNHHLCQSCKFLERWWSCSSILIETGLLWWVATGTRHGCFFDRYCRSR